MSVTAPSTRLFILRHGQSLWNRQKRFTGWTDTHLSEKGAKEAQRTAELLMRERVAFDVCFTSRLSRAVQTAKILLKTMQIETIPIHTSWRLNERHYGALQGLTWWEASTQYGAKNVLAWQRHYSARPPALSPDDPRFPGKDPQYSDIPPHDLPLAESLEDTQKRVIPFWQEEIFPALQQNKKIIIIAHHNSIRSLLKYLANISDHDIPKVTVKTAEPVVCDFDTKQHFLRYSYMRWPVKIQDLTKRWLQSLLP